MPWLLITILSPQTGFPQLLSAAVIQPRFCRQVNILFNNSVALTLSPCVSLIPFDLGTELTEYNCQSVCVCVCWLCGVYVFAWWCRLESVKAPVG